MLRSAGPDGVDVRVLVASRGSLPEDYAWTVPGELVAICTSCEAECSTCDLCVAFVGVASGRATTTARVSEVALTRDAYVDAVREVYVRADVECTVEEAEQEAGFLLALACALPPGALVRRRGDELRQQT